MTAQDFLSRLAECEGHVSITQGIATFEDGVSVDVATLVAQPAQPDGVFPHIAVTGRIHGDDEDSVYTFESMTEEQAREAFKDAIFTDRDFDAEARQGTEVYINHVLASTAPIEIVAFVYAN